MTLDPGTMYVIVAFAMILMGSAQLLAWKTGHFGAWAGCWGSGNVVFGCGAMGLVLINVLPAFVSSTVANALALCGQVLAVQAVRLFAGREAKWRTVAIVTIVASLPHLLSHDPAEFAVRIAYNNVLRIAAGLWIVAEGAGLARRERLQTAWTMVVLFGGAIPLYLGRIGLALSGALGANQLLAGNNAGHWLAVATSAFILLQGTTLMTVAAERNHNAVADSARLDGLTRALNRAGLSHLRRTLAGMAAMVLIDLDHFKALNDRRGHACGDAALRLLADCARAATPPGGSVVRMGGDEFLVILPCLAIDGAARVAAEIRARFAAALAALAIEPPLPTLSIGVAAGDLTGKGFEAVLHLADEALYRAKGAGRDQMDLSLLAA